MDVVNLKIQLSIYKTRFTADNMNKHNILFFQIVCEVSCCKTKLSDYTVGWIFLNFQIRRFEKLQCC